MMPICILFHKSFGIRLPERRGRSIAQPRLFYARYFRLVVEGGVQGNILCLCSNILNRLANGRVWDLIFQIVTAFRGDSKRVGAQVDPNTIAGERDI